MKQHIGNTAAVARPAWAFVMIATIFTAALVAAPARADVITEWNAWADEIAVAKKLLPTVYGRGQAILHVAMFEAVNAIERRYSPYRLTLTADRNASKEAAAAAAGYAGEFVAHDSKLRVRHQRL